jgi:hypothetical protein
MFEILFLAFAIIALLRLPKDVRRMRERKCSVLPSGRSACRRGQRPDAQDTHSQCRARCTREDRHQDRHRCMAAFLPARTTDKKTSPLFQMAVRRKAFTGKIRDQFKAVNGNAQ